MTSAKPGLPVWIALLGSGIAGALTAVQSRINGGLSQHLGNGYVTAAVSFGSGLVILCLVVVLSRRARRGFALVKKELASGHLPFWALSGGTFGAFFVLAQGLVATVIGLALFTVGVVAGQVLGGLVIDRTGLGPSGRVDPTLTRVIGMVLAMIAVVFSVIADIVNPAGETAQNFHLKQPILGVHVTEGAVHVRFILGANVRHAAFVVIDRDRRLQRAEYQLAIALRLLVMQVPGQAASCGCNHQRKGGQGTFHPAILIVVGQACEHFARAPWRRH